jgi:hypothetical protein
MLLSDTSILEYETGIIARYNRMKLLNKIVRRQKGSSTLFAISLAVVCIFLLLALFDLCSTYIIREQTKDVSEAVSLAIAQQLLFFEPDELILMAEKMAAGRYCSLAACNIGYDRVEISVERKAELAILDRIGLSRFKTVRSSSSVEIIYPWDRDLGLCRYYEFGY